MQTMPIYDKIQCQVWQKHYQFVMRFVYNEITKDYVGW